jgi:hypothetical protein
MSLPRALKVMLEGVSGIANSAVTYGSRPQGGAIPCITFTVQGNVPIAIGSNPIRRADVEIRSTDLTAEAAQALAQAVELQIATGTFAGVQCMGVYNLLSILEAPVPSIGDEAPTYTATTRFYVIYR